MKIAQINVASYGSTGRIMCQIQERALAEGYEARSYFGRGNIPDAKGEYTRIESEASVLWHVVKARLFDKMGHGSKLATNQLVKLLKEEKPDIIHLHNLHGYYINIKILFKYLRKSGAKLLWTLHDCWAFTGGCAYFTECGCEKWKTGCESCGQKHVYPKSYIDRSSKEYALKKKLFTGIPGLTLTTPSQWLAELVSASFLGEYPVHVVYNGIDTENFRPFGAETDTGTKGKLGIAPDCSMILGVANVWDERKRLSALIELAKDFQDKNAKVVVVGLNEKQKAALPEGIIGITRTENARQLAKLYSAADVFVSTSVEESFSLVVGEALACGTPVVCADGGGCNELVGDGVGIVVPRDDREALYRAVSGILESKEAFSAGCRKRCVENYSREAMVDGYIEVYKKIYEQ